MDKTVYIGLLGAGTVGSGVIEVLNKNASEIEARVGAPVKIKKVLVKDVTKVRDGLDKSMVTDSFDDILNDKDISIVVEVMGGMNPAKDYMLRAFNAGKCVVTANKDVIAACGKELFDAAKKNSSDLHLKPA